MFIKSLKIRNFKGIESLEIHPDGKDVDVFGANETRKTTIFDACTWLLTGKDSLGSSDFDIKPKSNPDIDVDVEGVFGSDNGGGETTLRRVFYTKFTRKRGEAKATSSGNTTDYHINGVSVPQNQYLDHLHSIADEQTLRLLTDARFFNEVMHWRQRRDSLVDWCGNITDADVINTDERFQEIPEILGKLTIKQFTDQARERKNTITDELGTPKKPGAIRIRIDETKRSITKAKNSTTTAKALIKKHKETISQKESELRVLESNPELTSKEADLSKAKSDLKKLVDAMEDSHNDNLRKNRSIIDDAKRDLKSIQDDKKLLEQQISSIQSMIKFNEDSLQPLYKRFAEIKAETFEPPAKPGNCPTCGHPIAKGKIDEANEKALEAFNSDRAQRLTSINLKGKSTKDAIAVDSEKLKAKMDELEKINQGIELRIKDVEKLESDYTAIEKPKPTDEIKALEAQVAELEKAIESVKANPASEIEALRAEIEDYRQRVDELSGDILVNENNAKAEKRVEQLKEQEETMAHEFEELERKLFLLDEFTRAKCSMLNDRINSNFETCKFKLFKDLANGGVDEICEMIDLNGASYWSTNNATRIKGGAEIIRIAQKHFGLKFFVFFDNRESVTEIPDMGCQTISLYVSPEDKELRIEYK